MLTQSITTAVLFATGDTMAQQGVEKKGLANHELGRTTRMALYGGCIFGPAATKWFGFLQRKIQLPGRPNLEILARVAADQVIFASCNLTVFLTSMAVMAGEDPREKLRSTYFNALSKNWLVWPAVQATNFKFVPLEHRVLVVNMVSLGKSCRVKRGRECRGVRLDIGRRRKSKERKMKEGNTVMGLHLQQAHTYTHTPSKVMHSGQGKRTALLT